MSLFKHGKKYPKTFHSTIDSLAIKHLIKTDLQLKNYFKLILLESTESDSDNAWYNYGTAIAGSIIGSAISVLYLKSCTISGVQITYEGITEKYARDIKSPESVSMTFIDDSKGLVRRYLIFWLKQSVLVSYNKAKASDNRDWSGSAGKTFLPQDNVSYVFTDNQLTGKKTGILLLANTVGKLVDPLNYPRTMMYGLRPTSVGDLTVSHEETGVMTYEVTFSVDEVATPLI